MTPSTSTTVSTPPIAVTGGTGTLGRLVVARLRAAGHDVRVLSRHGPDGTEASSSPARGAGEHVAIDLATGQGLAAALDGAEVIVHAAGSAKGDGLKARNLVRAARRTGARHIVFVSVVGADRIPVHGALDRTMFGYFAEKRAAEVEVATSGIGWSILRATQFHDLTLKTVQAMASMPIALHPAGWRLQPIEASEVADRLVELAEGGPAGLVEAMGGPRIHELSDLICGYLRATNRHRLLVSVPLPGAAAAAFRDGANLAPDRAVGRRTWEAFLADRLRQPATHRMGADAARS